MVTPVAGQAVAQVGLNHVFNQSFEHAEGFMTLPSSTRIYALQGNTYALKKSANSGVSTDYNNNINLNSKINTTYENKAIWTRPYTSFERLNLKNGPKLNMISYGTLISGDTDFRNLKHGWSNVGTVFIGYTGASMDYDKIDMTYNGGVIGVTESFYKKNFFTAITANVGAGFNEAHTMYGKEDMTMLTAGVASKSGYNFEFKEGKYIIQPNLMMSYSMVNTFDYKNRAGVKINCDPLHTIQIKPGIIFIANLKHGWQWYASIGMLFNAMNETKITANNVKLPECTTKPYVEYGIGLQKQFGENFSGYGQAMVRNGGRNGIALILGFRWAFPDRTFARDNKKATVNKKDLTAFLQSFNLMKK